MRTKKNLWIVLLLLILPHVVRADDVAPLVDGLQKTYQKHKHWQTQFHQSTFVELLGRQVERKGSMMIQKPGKLRVEYFGEGARIYTSDGKKLWVYSPEEMQVEIFSKISKIVAKEALAFLGGLGEISNEFVVAAVMDDDEKALFKSKKLKLLSLYPINEKSFLQKIVLGVDPSGYIVREMTLTNESGNVTHYIFEDVQFDRSAEDSMFGYQKIEGVREIKY